MCEDVDTVRSIIQTEKGWAVNVRFKVDQRFLKLAKIIVNAEKKIYS